MYSQKEESHLDAYRRWGKLAKPYFKWQFEQFSNYIGKRIGDIGCGLGNFVQFLNDRELYLGFEPDKELSREFNLLHKGENIKLAANGDVCSDKAIEEMKKSRLDTIICINVLEHIKDDKRVLSNMVEGVAKGGYICILVPALEVLFGSLDELDGHYRRYTKETLKQLVKGLEADIVKCHYFNLIGALGWYLKSRIIKEKSHGDENYTIINLLLPFISAIEKAIKPPFGLSLVMALRKK